MAPATKKRRTNNGVQTFHCFSCATDRVASQFPDYNPTPDCDHLINTCKTCLKKWVQTNVESGNLTTGGEDGKIFGVNCPQCDGIMRNVNVEIAATKNVYERFEELERKHIGDTTPGWRWCLSPACKAGQVHESLLPKEPPAKSKKRRGHKREEATAKAEVSTEPDIFVCHDCEAKACVPCDRPWHEGETCAEYQDRVKDRLAEEDEALEAIRKLTKNCPNCKKRIQKNGGCPAMFCTQCSTNFCWNCESIFGERGCKCSRR